MHHKYVALEKSFHMLWFTGAPSPTGTFWMLTLITLALLVSTVVQCSKGKLSPGKESCSGDTQMVDWNLYVRYWRRDRSWILELFCTQPKWFLPTEMNRDWAKMIITSAFHHGYGLVKYFGIEHWHMMWQYYTTATILLENLYTIYSINLGLIIVCVERYFEMNTLFLFSNHITSLAP